MAGTAHTATRAAAKAVEKAKADPVFQECEALAAKLEKTEDCSQHIIHHQALLLGGLFYAEGEDNGLLVGLTRFESRGRILRLVW